MATRVAACHCGQLHLAVEGEPFAVSICHCLACQRRTGSAFGMQAGDCGSQVFYTEPTEVDLIVVSAGAFADPSFPAPTESGYDSRRHPWVGLPESVARHAPEVWYSAQPLYEAGEYAAAADRGRELLEAHGEYPNLVYNLACCESLAGRTDEALEHLRQAIELMDGMRDYAKGDSDLDPIREEPAFEELVGA